MPATTPPETVISIVAPVPYAEVVELAETLVYKLSVPVGLLLYDAPKTFP